MNLKEKTVVIDNKTYRYSKIVMLPTEDRSNIFLNKRTKKLNYFLKGNNPNNANHQHLYFLSNDKICEGDICYYENSLGGGKFLVIYTKYGTYHELGVNPIAEYGMVEGGVTPLENEIFKVISSTDPSLNLPKPSDSFLQVYIDAYNKNEIIEECLVEYIDWCDYDDDNTWGGLDQADYRPKITKGEITIRKVKDSWSREEHLSDINNCIEFICNQFDYNRRTTIRKLKDAWISENL